MARWRILRSILQDKNAKAVSLVEIPGVERREGDGIFYAGDIIETEADLSKHNNQAEKKFEKLEGYEPITPKAENDGLEGMTVAELRGLAEREEIDLGDAITKKAEIIEAIRLQTSGASA